MIMEQQSLPDLEYDYADLQPAIAAEIMELHHSKHHNTYVTKLNEALSKYHDAEAQGDLAAMIALQPAINFNGGGHLNHSIFWSNLAPKSAGGGESPVGPLADAINAQWDSLDAFISMFNAKTAVVPGSGWGWLGYNKQAKSLEYTWCQNQDPVSSKGLVPLLGIDIWEHAYYLQYKNLRPAYLKAIWDVVNWKNVSERYEAAIQ
ncbi:Superoxide dismutase [Mn], mitochondrial [Chlamydiales bacterium SCGC AG-110-P3]|nr:Superoxide dismutase [Mn], mitochondrial [Chlamydiales bacterium SCGC AG-110-P3]